MNGSKQTSVRRECSLDWEGVREKVLTTEFKQKQGNQICKQLLKENANESHYTNFKGGWEGKLFIHCLKSSAGPWVDCIYTNEVKQGNKEVIRQAVIAG